MKTDIVPLVARDARGRERLARADAALSASPEGPLATETNGFSQTIDFHEITDADKWGPANVGKFAYCSTLYNAETETVKAVEVSTRKALQPQQPAEKDEKKELAAAATQQEEH